METIIIVGIIAIIAFLCFWYGWRGATFDCAENTEELIKLNKQLIENQERIIKLLEDKENKND